MSNLNPGKLIIITGKTASGKDTIISRILTHYPNLKKVITSTSRGKRVDERSDINYHFITQDEFKKAIENSEFVEYVEYGGNLYGTTKKDLDQALLGDTLWKIDPSRAGKIRQLIEKRDVLVIYINTADDVILQRLKKRGLSDMEIKKRMADDKKIWDQYKDSYDYVLENVPGKLEETIEQISTIIDKAHY